MYVYVCVCVCVCVCVGERGNSRIPITFLPLQAMLLVAPKLNAMNLNTQLLKYFAKCQLDEQVRTWLFLEWFLSSPPIPSARHQGQHHNLFRENSLSPGYSCKRFSQITFYTRQLVVSNTMNSSKISVN